MTVIAVIDYDVGNVKSIINALTKVGARALLSRDRDEILAADGVVLPGVGAYSHGMEKLQTYELVTIIEELAASDKPLLGICLGMQMLFEHSSEFGKTQGLGLIPGEVVGLKVLDSRYKKIPHVSWNELHEPELGRWESTILDGINQQEDMYFVHGFVACPSERENILSTTTYSNNEFCSSVKRGNIYGCQFHPEKSSIEGLRVIRNFVGICEEISND